MHNLETWEGPGGSETSMAWKWVWTAWIAENQTARGQERWITLPCSFFMVSKHTEPGKQKPLSENKGKDVTRYHTFLQRSGQKEVLIFCIVQCNQSNKTQIGDCPLLPKDWKGINWISFVRTMPMKYIVYLKSAGKKNPQILVWKLLLARNNCVFSPHYQVLMQLFLGYYVLTLFHVTEFLTYPFLFL